MDIYPFDLYVCSNLESLNNRLEALDRYVHTPTKIRKQEQSTTEGYTSRGPSSPPYPNLIEELPMSSTMPPVSSTIITPLVINVLPLQYMLFVDL